MLTIDDEALIERYFERCAIMELDGGLTRLESTSHCFGKLEQWCKNQGRGVPDAAIKDLAKLVDTTKEIL